MKLHILGCGDASGSGGRHQSAYLIETTDRLFLLVCGPAALLSMKRAAIEPRRLDVIFLSHLHGDHFGGLPFFVIKYLYREPRTRPLTIAGPTGTEARVRQLLAVTYSGAKEISFLNFKILASAMAQMIRHRSPSLSRAAPNRRYFARPESWLPRKADSFFR